MNTIKTCAHFLLTSLLILLGCTNNTQPENNTNTGDITLPDGFSSIIVADSLGEGRHVIVNTNGDIYVSLRNIKNGGCVVGLTDLFM